MKAKYCPECGSKVSVAGSSPPKFCSECGLSFNRGQSKKNDTEEEIEEPMSHLKLSREDIEIKKAGRQKVTLGDLAAEGSKLTDSMKQEMLNTPKREGVNVPKEDIAAKIQERCNKYTRSNPFHIE